MSAPTFLGMAQDLMTDADAKAAFDADPEGFLVARGFEDLAPADVSDALGFVAETLPPDAARVLTDPDAEAEGLARLARLDPALVSSSGDDDPGPGDDFGAGHAAASPDDRDAEPDDEQDDEQDDEEEHVDLGLASDPTELADDTDPTLEQLRDHEVEPGFGVGFADEDVDDVSPPGLDLHL